MGQKVNPHGFRLGKLYSWDSQWYAKGKNYQKFLLEDVKLREFLMKELESAGIVRVEIKRSINHPILDYTKNSSIGRIKISKDSEGLKRCLK